MKLFSIICALLVVVTSYHAWVAPIGEDAQADRLETGYFGPHLGTPEEAAAEARRVRSLEIVHYNNDQASVQKFQVRLTDRGWVIPSHHNYPADGGDRVGRTAGSVLGIVKHGQAFITDDPRRFEELGLIDPEQSDAAYGAQRAQRVTLGGPQDEVMLSLLIGKSVEGQSGWRYVREAGNDRVYRAQVDPYLTTRFTDWVNQDLIGIDRNSVRKLVIDPHDVDELAGTVVTPPKIPLERKPSGQEWTSPSAPDQHMVDAEVVRKMLDGITRVRLQGVRPLQPLTVQRIMRFGFFTNDGSTVFGNDGALEVHSTDGLVRVLYFGQVAPDDGIALTAGLDNEDDSVDAGVGGNNRYMIILVRYDEKGDEQLRDLLADATAKANEEVAEGESLSEEVQRQLTAELNRIRTDRVSEMNAKRDQDQIKFGEFFYVIAGSVFNDLRPDLQTIFRAVEKVDPSQGSNPETINP